MLFFSRRFRKKIIRNIFTNYITNNCEIIISSYNNIYVSDVFINVIPTVTEKINKNINRWILSLNSSSNILVIKNGSYDNNLCIIKIICEIDNTPIKINIIIDPKTRNPYEYSVNKIKKKITAYLNDLDIEAVQTNVIKKTVLHLVLLSRLKTVLKICDINSLFINRKLIYVETIKKVSKYLPDVDISFQDIDKHAIKKKIIMLNDIIKKIIQYELSTCENRKW